MQPTIKQRLPLKWNRFVALDRLAYNNLYRFGTILLFVAMAVRSWQKLGDPIVDMGHEVEIPARIADGQILYRDIHSYYGPLAFYINAWGLELFGKHLNVFYGIGLVIAALIAVAIYQLVRRSLDESYAFLVTSCVLVYCTFSPGISNLVFPYSFGTTYATLAIAFAFVLLVQQLERPSPFRVFGLGILSGLAALAKPEFGVACMAAMLATLTFGALSSQKNPISQRFWQVGLDALLLFIGSGVLILPVMAWFLQYVSFDVLFGENLFPTKIFTLLQQGRDFQVSPTKTWMVWLTSARSFLLFTLPIGFWLWVVNRFCRHRWQRIASVAVGILCLWLAGRSFVFGRYDMPLNYLQWSLPLLFGVITLRFAKLSRAVGSETALLLGAIFTYLIVLNLRWGLAGLFYEIYSVFLVVAFCLCIGLYQRYCNHTFPAKAYLLVCATLMFGLQWRYFQGYEVALTSPYGTVWTRHSSALAVRDLNRTLRFLESNLRPKDRDAVLILPEGAVLSFLSGTHSPSQQTTFFPGVLPDEASEDRFIATMKKKSIRYVVYVDYFYDGWPWTHYKSYNPKVHEWVTRKFRLVADFKNIQQQISIYEPLKP
jgi:Dolichyl-phosphate-mannose-protein mannosyltransferase